MGEVTESATPQAAPGMVAEAPAGAPVVRRLGRTPVTGPRALCLDATRAAERRHGIPEGLMTAIALAESGLHAYAMNVSGRPHYPTEAGEARRLYLASQGAGSIMAGCVQVNARVHARNDPWPLDPDRSADWGAAYLRQHYDRIGDWAGAIRRWNGGGPGNNGLVCRVHAKLAVVNPRSDALRGAPCGTNMAEQRNGRAHLEVAEAGDR